MEILNVRIRALVLALCVCFVWSPAGSNASAQVITEFDGIVTGSPREITTGPDGNLWFTESGIEAVARLTPMIVVTEFPFTISCGSGPGSGCLTGRIAPGSDGALWFVSFQANVGRITVAGAMTFLGPPAGPAADITGGSDGNLWATSFLFDRILRITPGGTVTEFPIPTVGGRPWGIAAGSDGNLWFTEKAARKIGRVTPTGTVSEIPLPFGTGAPGGIASGPDGALWFVVDSPDQIGRITTGGAISLYPIPTIGCSPQQITAGPDGNLWFTEQLGNKIGRITPSGVITEFDVPTLNSAPRGIAAGPDGNIWFTEELGFKIGRVNLVALEGVAAPALSPLALAMFAVAVALAGVWSLRARY